MDNSSLQNLEKFSLGRGQLIRVKAAIFGKYWRTRDGGEVVETPGLGEEVEKLSKERTSGNFECSYLISLGTEWR